MISNKFLVLIFLLALCACKSQTAVAPLVIRDSISITYKQGQELPTPSLILCNPPRVAGDKEQPASLDAIGAATSQFLWNQQRIAGDSNEQPSPSGLRGAQTAFRRNSSAPAFGKVGLGATREASVSEEALSERTNKKAVPPTPIIRVDTMFVERWHTTEVPSPPKPIPRFYKRCMWGFFILILLLLGRIAFRIMKAIYLRK